MKKVSKAQAAKIAEVLKYAKIFSDDFVTTYDGGTYPYVVDIQSISVSPSGQFVTIDGGTNRDAYIKKERFNVNDAESSKDLNRALSVILRAYKKIEKEYENFGRLSMHTYFR